MVPASTDGKMKSIGHGLCAIEYPMTAKSAEVLPQTCAGQQSTNEATDLSWQELIGSICHGHALNRPGFALLPRERIKFFSLHSTGLSFSGGSNTFRACLITLSIPVMIVAEF
jgi:hypothetical protein